MVKMLKVKTQMSNVSASVQSLAISKLLEFANRLNFGGSAEEAEKLQLKT
jgi:hypothetical protein